MFTKKKRPLASLEVKKKKNFLPLVNVSRRRSQSCTPTGGSNTGLTHQPRMNYQSAGSMLNQVSRVIQRQARPITFTCVILAAFVFVIHQQHVNPLLLVRQKCKRVLPVHQERAEDVGNKYISPLCNCGKETPIGDGVNVSDVLDEDTFKWCSDESSLRGDHQKIVTYALYGNVHNMSIFKRYFSHLKNISLTVEKQYPGWVIRIYHNIRDRQGPEKEAHNQLCDVYCRYEHVDLCSVPLLADRIGNDTTPIDPQLIRGLNPKMYRYLVMLDPNVDIFISRDVDSIIWPREVDAVREWLPSNYTFHLMRDHMFHGSIMLAGTHSS